MEQTREDLAEVSLLHYFKALLRQVFSSLYKHNTVERAVLPSPQ